MVRKHWFPLEPEQFTEEDALSLVASATHFHKDSDYVEEEAASHSSDHSCLNESGVGSVKAAIRITLAHLQLDVPSDRTAHAGDWNDPSISSLNDAALQAFMSRGLGHLMSTLVQARQQDVVDEVYAIVHDGMQLPPRLLLHHIFERALFTSLSRRLQFVSVMLLPLKSTTGLGGVQEKTVPRVPVSEGFHKVPVFPLLSTAQSQTCTA
ncbi:hypothetical protein JOB18_011673 [Solea senegalensis]|uniref:Uncharacterized protein n=1 Tax=Solea senegalensis TaxID=28829 RepID=A0AAV6RCP0_SOLSE|nr:hypothetical protein JOB18_011673 [Solea senegalensis]